MTFAESHYVAVIRKLEAQRLEALAAIYRGDYHAAALILESPPALGPEHNQQAHS